MAQIVIIHGWSDDSDSFEPLADFLSKNGHAPVPIWLGDYVSMDDDVRIPDVAERLEAELRSRVEAGELTAPFDMIVHSTGGLVAREWIATYNDDAWRPVRRLVMLAPANFGSVLAAKGKSLLGRIVKGWNNWFHTGKEMLNSLEIASPYQWDLAHRDIFVPRDAAEAPAFYGADQVLPFVIVGSHPYAGVLQEITNEDGSDGTVRVAAANLDAVGATIDFSVDESNPTFTPWPRRFDFPIPLAVLPARTHGSIINPDKGDIETADDYRDPLGDLILEALDCADFAEYGAIAQKWDDLSEDTAALARDVERRRRLLPDDDEDDSAEYFHQYLQTVVRVVDDHGAQVDDYFLELFGPSGVKGDDAFVYLHREVLERVDTNSLDSSRRCLFVDRTDLVERYYRDFFKDPKDGVLLMSISAAPPGDNVRYFGRYQRGASGNVQLHAEDPDGRRLHRNKTHFVEIVIPRVPADKVFKLRAYP
jgi:pimeloyl-ACP methyl ester carboxylesterase